MIPSPLLVVTDRHGSARPLVETVRAVLDGGARWIWFRDKDLEPAARRDLALQLLDLVRGAGGRLTIGGDTALADEIGADGVHLGAGHVTITRPTPEALGYRAASPEPPPRAEGEAMAKDALSANEIERRPLLMGVSAHGPGDVRRAAEAGAGYVTLSPIFASASKPGYGPELGLGVLRDAAAIGLPLIALGGIGPDRAGVCRAAGAAGVAVMGGLMRASDPAAATRRFLRALQPVI